LSTTISFAGKVVGSAMESHLKTELVLAAINTALAQRRPEGVIHHSDRGELHYSCSGPNFGVGQAGAARVFQLKPLPARRTGVHAAYLVSDAIARAGG
jgi:hypothetical protein